MTSTQSNFERDGFELCRSAVGNAPIGEWLRAASRQMESAPEGRVTRFGEPYAMRAIVSQCPYIAACIRETILPRLVRPILGSNARLVRSLLLDKTPENNWGVPWHRDLQISVNDQAEIEGYHGWRLVDDGWYVEPPFEVLQNMVTVRVHLDDCGVDDGPLSVIPGSHLWPAGSREEIADRAKSEQKVECHALSGDALVMRPLLVHSSERAIRPCHRRVVHLEFCNQELPGTLNWRD